MQPITVAQRALFSATPAARVMAAAQRATGTQLIVEEVPQRFHFQQTLPVGRRTRHLYLFGYWQTFHIAQAVESQLRHDLAFRSPAEGRTREVLGEIAAAALPISLHVRRGDYATAAEGHRTLPLDYYRAALRHFGRLGSPTYFVFSDDIAWCRAELAPALNAEPGGAAMVFVDHNDDLSSHEDLRLQSACRHHILANSSFSWWGAWLNGRPDKQVFAPRFWLLTPDSYYPDLLPPEWTLWPRQ